jgi:PAS domain S-box-containing protein
MSKITHTKITHIKPAERYAKPPSGELKLRAEAALRRGEFDLAEQLLAQENIELDTLIENLRIYQAELEIQNAELREAQLISQQALERFSKLFSHLPLAELVIDRTGLILQANDKAAELFALHDTALRRHYLRRLIQSEDENELGRVLVMASQHGAGVIDQMHFCAADGRTFIGALHVARLPAEAEQTLELACAIIDLSQRIKAESRIAALAAVVEHSNDIIVVKDLDLRVIATNMAFVRASGHKAVSDLIGKTDAEIFNVSPQQEPVCSYMKDDAQAQTLRPGEFILREEPVMHPSGEITYVLTRKYPIHDTAGVLLGTGNISVDISERKRSEELERFGAFQAGIAEMSTTVLHNVGNAMTSVIQNAANIEHASTELLRVADLLETNIASVQAELDANTKVANMEVANMEVANTKVTNIPDTVNTLLTLLQRQFAIQVEAARAIRSMSEDALCQPARRLKTSVAHIADIVRIQQGAALPSGKRSSFSLTQVIQSALDMQGDAFIQRNILVSLKVDPAVELVTLSQNLMLQTLVNVIRNSVEALDERSQQESFKAFLKIEAEAMADNRFRLTLQDNGIGFAAAKQDQLFLFGYSSKPRGTGFGLPSVAVFAHESGGKVSIHSPGLGQGACLTLELPLRAKTITVGR